jgi:hypothetical protein
MPNRRRRHRLGERRCDGSPRPREAGHAPCLQFWSSVSSLVRARRGATLGPTRPPTSARSRKGVSGRQIARPLDHQRSSLPVLVSGGRCQHIRGVVLPAVACHEHADTNPPGGLDPARSLTEEAFVTSLTSEPITITRQLMARDVVPCSWALPSVSVGADGHYLPTLRLTLRFNARWPTRAPEAPICTGRNGGRADVHSGARVTGAAHRHLEDVQGGGL